MFEMKQAFAPDAKKPMEFKPVVNAPASGGGIDDLLAKVDKALEFSNAEERRNKEREEEERRRRQYSQEKCRCT